MCEFIYWTLTIHFGHNKFVACDMEQLYRSMIIYCITPIVSISLNLAFVLIPIRFFSSRLQIIQGFWKYKPKPNGEENNITRSKLSTEENWADIDRNEAKKKTTSLQQSKNTIVIKSLKKSEN